MQVLGLLESDLISKAAPEGNLVVSQNKTYEDFGFDQVSGGVKWQGQEANEHEQESPTVSEEGKAGSW